MGQVAAPTAVRFEHRTDEDPVLGIRTATPRLSWIVPAADAGFVQEAYEVELTRAGRAPEVVRVTSGEQVLVPWPATPLTSRESVTLGGMVPWITLRSRLLRLADDPAVPRPDPTPSLRRARDE